MDTLHQDESKCAPADFLPANFPAALAEAASLRALNAGQGLFWAGDPVRSLFLLIEGEIRLTHHFSDGREVVLQTIASQQMMVECSLCISTYSCSAVALVPSRVVAIGIAAFNNALREDNDFAVAWGFDLARRLREMYLREERLRLKTTRERVLHFLHTQDGADGSVRLDISVKTWARELGVTYENLYRTLAALERAGELERNGRRLSLTPQGAGEGFD